MKYVLTLILLLLATIVSAATVYDVYDTPYTNAHYEGTAGSYYTIKFNQDAKLWITDFLNNIKSETQTELLTSPTYGLEKYGYVDADKVVHEFDITDESRIKQLDYYEYNVYKLNQGLPADKFYRNGYYLGDFKAGDEIELYLSNGIESVASNSPNGSYISSFGRRVDSLDSSLPIAQLYLSGTQVNFGLTAVGIENSGGGASTFGSPLPTPITTLLIACGFVGLFILYRRKQLKGDCF